MDWAHIVTADMNKGNVVVPMLISPYGIYLEGKKMYVYF